MNWYKVAEKKPIIISKLEPLCWIDPNKTIYKVSYSHLQWIFKNADFLEEKYNLKLYPMKNWEDDKNIIANKNILIKNGWIRSRYTYDWYIDMQNLNDIGLINFLGDKIFEVLGPSNNELFNFLIYDYKNQKIEFYWQDYLGEGLNFSEYLRTKVK